MRTHHAHLLYLMGFFHHGVALSYLKIVDRKTFVSTAKIVKFDLASKLISSLK